MNDRDLKYFCKLVEVENYTETAKLFNVTQPTISAAVKRLEENYGVPLFSPHNNRSQLITTHAGTVLYIQARKILKKLTEINVEVAHANDDKLKLGFSNIAGGIWLPKVLKKFKNTNMMNMIQTVDKNSESLIKDLELGKIDAAVLSTLQPLQLDTLSAQPLEVHELCVIVSLYNKFRNHDIIDVNELRNEPFIARPKKALTREALDVYCHQADFKPKIFFQADNNALVQQLVAENLGVGFVIDGSILLNEQLKRIRLKKDQVVKFYMQLAVRKSFLPNERQKRCLEILKQLKE